MPTRKKPSHEPYLARLKEEISLKRDFVSDGEALFLSITWTWSCIERVGRQFFTSFGITDSQFNALMILRDHRPHALKQHELADLLVVNRASAGAVIDRLEKNGWVCREVDAKDRRAFRVHLTEAGSAKLEEVGAAYYELLGAALKEVDPQTLSTVLRFNDAFRARLAEVSR